MEGLIFVAAVREWLPYVHLALQIHPYKDSQFQGIASEKEVRCLAAIINYQISNYVGLYRGRAVFSPVYGGLPGYPWDTVSLYIHARAMRTGF